MKVFPFDEETITIDVKKYKKRLEWLFEKYAEADNHVKESILFGQMMILSEIIGEIGVYDRCREIDRQKNKSASEQADWS